MRSSRTCWSTLLGKSQANGQFIRPPKFSNERESGTHVTLNQKYKWWSEEDKLKAELSWKLGSCKNHVYCLSSRTHKMFQKARQGWRRNKTASSLTQMIQWSGLKAWQIQYSLKVIFGLLLKIDFFHNVYSDHDFSSADCSQILPASPPILINTLFFSLTE